MGTIDDDIFYVSGAPSLINGEFGFDIARISASITFSAGSIQNIERFDILGGLKVSFSNLAGGYYIYSGPGITKSVNITGSSGDDHIVGSNANDTIDAVQGNDIIEGGAGNDTLTGGPGYDQIYGGEGDDFIQVKRGTGGDLIDGGAGIDRLSLDAGTRTENLSLDISDPAIVQYLGEGSIISGIEQLTATGGTGADRFVGGALADTLNGGDGDDILKCGGGNDALNGGANYDVAVYAGAYSSYQITDLGSGKYSVASGLEGTDTLTGIETLRFADGDRPIGGYLAGASYWGSPDGTGTLVGATRIPDGRGANPGTGFTITGLVRLADGSFWASNEGQADALDTTYTPSLVHIASDGITKIGEITLPSSVRAVQGLAVDELTGRLFYASLSEKMVRIVNMTGAQLGSIKLSLAANALTYEASTDSLILGVSKGSSNNSIVQWLSLATGTLTKTLDVGVNPDHLFLQADKGPAGTLYVSYGEAPGTGYVAEFDVQSGTKTGRFALPAADAIEGIAIVGNTLWAANDAYYHHGNPPENRILQFQIADNATQLIRSGTSVGLNIDLGTHDQLLADGSRLVGIDRLYFAGGEGDDNVKAGALDDVLVGNGGNDRLFGEGGNDRLVGGSGNDLLAGGSGNNRLEGADGIDTALLTGQFADYSFTRISASSLSVTDNRAQGDGTDLVADIEYFTFQDGTFSFDNLFNPPATLGALHLIGTTINENSPVGTIVGQLEIDNPDNVPITYSMLDDAGGRFMLVGTQIVTGATPIDYEQSSSYQLMVRAIDTAHNRVRDAGIVINAQDINEAPTGILVSNLVSLSELLQLQTRVADLSVVDPDTDPAFRTQSVTVDDARFIIENGTLYLKPGQLLSHGSEPVITLTLSAGEGAEQISRSLAVIVDSAEAPTGIGLSNMLVSENLPYGTVVGTLALGPGAVGTVSYEIVADMAGDFRIDGDKLLLARPLDYESAASTLVTVRGTDQAGRTVDQQLVIGVIDGNDAPTSLSVTNLNPVPNHGNAPIHVADLQVGDADQDPRFREYAWQVSDTRFEVIGSSLYLKAQSNIDNGASSSIALSLTLQDGSAFLSTSLTIAIRAATEGDDVGQYAIFGTAGADQLSGLGGNDEIYGYGGNDSIDGGNGNDAMWGGDGTDNIQGGLGDDVIDGGSGADVIDGGAGTDAASYASAQASVRIDMLTPGNNQGDAAGDALLNIENIRGSSFADRIQGNNSANSILGGLGNDIIAGGGGTDKLYGNEGDDNLSGQGGNDLIDGGAGNDTLAGGSGGADTFIFSGGWGNDVITDYEANLDVLDFKSGGIALSDLTITQVGADSWIYGSQGESLRLVNTNKSNILLTTAPASSGPVLGIDLSANIVVENAPAGTLIGLLNATTTGAAGALSLSMLDDAGGRFAINNGSLVATGLAMNYELSTSYLIKMRVADGNGKFADKSFNITLQDANDAPSAITLSNQIGIAENSTSQTKIADIIITDEDLASAFRTYSYQVDDSRFTVINNALYLKAGQVVDYEAASSIPLTLSVTDGSFMLAKAFVVSVIDVNEAPGSLTYNGTGGDDIINTDADLIYGRRGNDQITATNPYKATISGGEGNDYIIYLPTGAGYAIIHGDDQNDHIVGAGGADQLYGDGGADYIDGGLGDDLIDGGDSDDWLLGGAGNDTINGGTGADTIFGGDGDDRITGGTDNDLIYGGPGQDSIDGGTGSDTISYAYALAGVKADLKTASNNLGEAKGDTFLNVENLTGGDFDDQLTGTDGTNILIGGNGNDVLNGLGGTDTLYGGAGNDRLSGQGGTDWLNGGLGDDILSGGSSSIDTFAFDRILNSDGSLTGWGNDSITDFERGSDHISLHDTGLSFDAISITQVGSDTVILDPLSGSTITLLGINASLIGVNDFYF